MIIMLLNQARSWYVWMWLLSFYCKSEVRLIWKYLEMLWLVTCQTCHVSNMSWYVDHLADYSSPLSTGAQYLYIIIYSLKVLIYYNIHCRYRVNKPYYPRRASCLYSCSVLAQEVDKSHNLGTSEPDRACYNFAFIIITFVRAR